MSDLNVPPQCHLCTTTNCYRKNASFPSICITAAGIVELDSVRERYRTDVEANRVLRVAAQTEARAYGKMTRVEETIEFAREMGYRKIGIASCVGLAREANLFGRMLSRNGFDVCGVICKVGAIDKTELGIPEEHKLKPGCFEAACNPLLQAELLNREKTDFNVMIGLCVGHDSLFIKHSNAPVTVLIAKDRVLVHNPAAALYASGFYYQHLMQVEPNKISPEPLDC
ncbi:MAG: DUF1847 domain-containing protein [Syntrophomonadaceae bacterium]|nr:DUF1847 domain-containing protein [Syntrophomonadaceae bacterium]